jgi:hypothetical protein
MTFIFGVTDERIKHLADEEVGRQEALNDEFLEV